MQAEQNSLLDVIDSALDTGVAARGEIVLSVADIDLVYISLGLVISEFGKLQNASTTPKKQEDLPQGESAV